MFDTELYQQVLGLTAPRKVTEVRLDVESTEIHVHVDHPEGSGGPQLLGFFRDFTGTVAAV